MRYWWGRAAVDSWRIVPGGDSAHLVFRLALSNVTFGGLGVSPGASLPALNVDIKTALRFQRRDTTNPTRQLKVAPPPDDGSGARAITATLDQTALQLGVVPRTTLQNAINAWLADHTADFSHVFAEIDVMDKAATGDFAWLAATSVDYAYSCDANAASLDHAVVGVLAMTNGRPDDLNEALVSQKVIPDAARAGCLITSGLYLEQALLPRLPGLL